MGVVGWLAYKVRARSGGEVDFFWGDWVERQRKGACPWGGLISGNRIGVAPLPRLFGETTVDA